MAAEACGQRNSDQNLSFLSRSASFGAASSWCWRCRKRNMVVLCILNSKLQKIGQPPDVITTWWGRRQPGKLRKLLQSLIYCNQPHIHTTPRSWDFVLSRKVLVLISRPKSVTQAKDFRNGEYSTYSWWALENDTPRDRSRVVTLALFAGWLSY